MSSNDLKESLLKDVLKTGYPFEMEITARMNKENWKVINGSYYIDKDENKGREIDIIAQKHRSETFDNHLTLEVLYSMIVEIKKAENKPWVFFTSESTKIEKIIIPKRFASTKFTLGDSGLRKILFHNIKSVQKRIGKNFYQGFTGNGARDDIYKALSGTTKAMNHFIENNNYVNDESGDRLLELFESVVIIKDDIFEAYLDDNGDLKIEEVNYVQTYFNYISPNYSNHDRNIVHIFNERYLEEFLQEKESMIHNLFNHLKTQEMKFLS